MDLVRGMTAPQLEAVRRSTFYPGLAVRVDWPNDPLHFHMGRGDIGIDGVTFNGFGELASLSLPGEAPSLAAAAGTLSLAGVPVDLGGVLDQPSRGTPVVVYLLLLADRANRPRIGPAIPIFRGTTGTLRMRTSKVDDVTILHRVEVDLTTGPSARSGSTIFHTNEDQSRAYPGDTAGRLTILAYSNAQKLRWPE